MSELLKINVNDHTEKKGNLTYLSWAWAWAEVLKVDPAAAWEAIEYPNPDGTLGPCMWIGDTAMVKTRVTVLGNTKTCQLAVMDNKNAAVKNPDARKISDAIMRCMTKAIGMHGLGLYIYAGEDLPEGEEPPKPEAKAETRAPRIPVTKGSMEALTPDRQKHLGKVAVYVIERFEADDVIAAHDEVYKITDDLELMALSSLIPSHVRTAIRKHHETTKEEA